MAECIELTKQIGGKTITKKFKKSVIQAMEGRGLNGWEKKTASKPSEIDPGKSQESTGTVGGQKPVEKWIKADWQARYAELYGAAPKDSLTVPQLKQAISDKELELEEINK